MGSTIARPPAAAAVAMAAHHPCPTTTCSRRRSCTSSPHRPGPCIQCTTPCRRRCTDLSPSFSSPSPWPVPWKADGQHSLLTFSHPQYILHSATVPTTLYHVSSFHDTPPLQHFSHPRCAMNGSCLFSFRIDTLRRTLSAFTTAWVFFFTHAHGLATHGCPFDTEGGRHFARPPQMDGPQREHTPPIT
jgi:hypothetical protein